MFIALWSCGLVTGFTLCCLQHKVNSKLYQLSVNSLAIKMIAMNLAHAEF